MDATRRIKLKRKLAKAFLVQEKSFQNIDFVLQEHGVPILQSWSGPIGDDYILASLNGVSDDTLLQLGNYFNLSSNSPLPNTRFGFWKNGYFRLFISHTSEHKREIGRLKTALEDEGISAFVAHEDIEPSAEWQNEIELALQTCDAFCAMLTTGFIESKWCGQEAGFAYGLRKFILPVRIGLDPYGFLGKLQGLSSPKINSAHLSKRISSLLRENLTTATAMRAAVMTAFCNSESYAQSLSLIDTIESYAPYSGDEIFKLRDAARKNTQISQAYKVPDRLEKAIRRQQRTE